MLFKQKPHIILIFLLLFINTLSYGATLPPTESQRGMVVSSQHLASKVGIDILNRGGNAIDAAVAVGYALAVVHPCCGNIGGGGFMLIHQSTGQNIFLNFREKAPEKLKSSMFLDKKGNIDTKKVLTSYLGAGVPGTVMGLNTALKKYGTLPLSEVMAPAIKLAKNGYKLQQGDVKILEIGKPYFKKDPKIAAIFLNNNKSFKKGDILKQPQLAKTLERIAKEGTDAFYKGEIARKIVEANKKNGGVMSASDLANYTITETKPISCQYHGYTIYTAPLPSSGGITLCEMLNITNVYPISFLGFHSARAAHYSIEAMRYAYQDRNDYLGDPTFVKVPVKKLLSKKHAKAIRSNISNYRASESTSIPPEQTIMEGTDTTHFSIVDKFGNAVSFTYTINGYFGNAKIPGDTGFFLNNEMDDFTIKPQTINKFGLIQGKHNKIAPGKQPLSSMTPTIILKDKKLFMVLGAPGGSTIPTQIFETIQNVIDFKMNIQEAVDAPRYHMQWYPDKVYMEQFTFSNDTQEKLAMMGYQLQFGSPYKKSYWGAVAAILKNLHTGQLSGAIDSRRPAGSALGN